MTTTIRGWTAAAAVALVAGIPSHAQGQAGTDAWYAFLGCWAPESGAGPSLCIRPTLDGVELARIADGQVVSREQISTRAGGVESEREGCRGEHGAAFSADGHRVFLTSDFVCEGGGARHETGILALVDADVLLDVRSVDVEGEPVAWTQIYLAAPASVGRDAGIADLPAPGMALQTSRRVASARIDTDDVVEALDAVGAGAVEAWVAETGDGFDLDAETLLALSDEGVPAPILDLMIAVSYPDRFALAVDDGEAAAERLSSGAYRGGPVLAARGVGYAGCYGLGSRYADPFFYDPFFSGCGYRYSRYSYGPYGYSRGWYGSYNPGVVIIGQPGGTARDNGRVVNGRGYTRGGDRSSTGSGATTSVGSTRTGGASTGSAGSAGTPTRRAKPRGGGGGGLF